MNVTQATFVILQTAPALDRDILSKGHQTFLTLFSRYFKETMKVSVMHPDQGTWLVMMVCQVNVG